MRSMLKRMILVAAFIGLLVNSAYAVEQVRILVLPFEIHALEQLGYLESEIPKVLTEHLEREGAIILETGTVPDVLPAGTAGPDIGRLRRIGSEKGADHVIWGSLTWIGQKFSLDARSVRSRGKEAPQVYFVEGEGVENLLGSVGDLSRDISVKLFRLEKVVEVNVVGNHRIEADAVKRVIRTKPGDIYIPKSVPKDIKSIYAMGYFDDIRVDVKNAPGGKVVTFTVIEKPTVRQVAVQGNKVFEDDEILDDVDIKRGSILNIFKVQSNIKQMEQKYREKNYHHVVVKYSVRELESGQADLIFVIKEGPKILVKAITFIGNKDYSSKELKRIMKTSEKGFFSWITSSGDLKAEDLEEDISRLSSFYHQTGYANVRVGEPKMEYQNDWIYITIKIDEGHRFKVGKVDIQGDLVGTKQALLEQVNISREEYYNAKVIHEDMLALTDIYSDEGYASVDIVPKVEEAEGAEAVDIAYAVTKGKQVYFERINITGNKRTLDKVVRRELAVHEQGLFSGSKLKRSVRNLHRLDYFEDIKPETSMGSAEDKIVLDIAVEEKFRGSVLFGGGYGGYQGVFFQGGIEVANFLGRGHDVRLRTELGERRSRYSLSYTEPWLFDIPLSAGIDAYNLETDYDTYVKSSMGFGFRFSYRIFDYTWALISYSYDIGEIRDISLYAPETVGDFQESRVTSTLGTALRYDSRDRMFNPTEGSNHSITLRYAGLGGDVGFGKVTLESGWYFPIYKRLVGFLHGEGAYIREVAAKEMPDYERFYLGGMNSVRGFDFRGISPEKLNSFGLVTQIGGDKLVQFNAELLVTLMEKETGLVFVIFYDAGNAFDNHERIDLGSLHQSAGYGFRWYSPMGPIRLEYGHILNPEPGGPEGGSWDFTMGWAF